MVKSSSYDRIIKTVLRARISGGTDLKRASVDLVCGVSHCDVPGQRVGEHNGDLIQGRPKAQTFEESFRPLRLDRRNEDVHEGREGRTHQKTCGSNRVKSGKGKSMSKGMAWVRKEGGQFCGPGRYQQCVLALRSFS